MLLIDVAPGWPGAVNPAAHSEYARLADMSPEALTAAIEPYYLPTVRLRLLLGPAASPSLRERLLQRIDRKAPPVESDDAIRKRGWSRVEMRNNHRARRHLTLRS